MMEVGRILGANLNLGAPEGWEEERDGPCNHLPVRVERIEGAGVTMTSCWKPTQQEMLDILAGGAIYLRIVGSAHPPVMIWAEPPPPDEDLNPYGAPPHGQE